MAGAFVKAFAFGCSVFAVSADTAGWPGLSEKPDDVANLQDFLGDEARADATRVQKMLESHDKVGFKWILQQQVSQGGESRIKDTLRVLSRHGWDPLEVQKWIKFPNAPAPVKRQQKWTAKKDQSSEFLGKKEVKKVVTEQQKKQAEIHQLVHTAIVIPTVNVASIGAKGKEEQQMKELIAKQDAMLMRAKAELELSAQENKEMKAENEKLLESSQTEESEIVSLKAEEHERIKNEQQREGFDLDMAKKLEDSEKQTRDFIVATGRKLKEVDHILKYGRESDQAEIANLMKENQMLKLQLNGAVPSSPFDFLPPKPAPTEAPKPKESDEKKGEGKKANANLMQATSAKEVDQDSDEAPQVVRHVKKAGQPAAN